MGKVLLLNPPGKHLFLRDQHCSSVSKADYYWPPIDLLVLSGILSQEYEVQVIDAIIERKSESECFEIITREKPDVIVFLTGISSWLRDFSFVERAKEKTGCQTIASGGFLLSDWKRVMEKYPFLDAIIMDYTSESILSYLRGERENLFDICFRDSGKILSTPDQMLRKFTIPVPKHELFPLYKYRLPHGRYRPFSSILTNYGCPYRCSYCIAEKSNFKYRPVDNVIPELEWVRSLGVRELFFKDFTFGIPGGVARELCREMASRFEFSWICSSRVDVLDETILRLMKRAGCHTIQFGVESASQDLLDDNEKKVVLKQISETFKLCRELGIKTLAHFILGLPGETEKSLRETVDFAKKIDCDYASFNVAIPLPGTTLRQRCLENGWLVSDQEELDSSRGYPVIETSFLSREKLWKLRNKALHSFYLRPGYIIKKLFQIRSLSDLLLLSRQGFSLLLSIRK
jgi:anaerobic magnesium-protoporphyrin IX monomethyl ester cyclase